MNDMTCGVLEMLREGDGYLSGELFSERLGISRAAVWKHVRQLRNAGYRIEGLPRRGYRLLSSPDLPSEMEIRPWLETGVLGRRILFYEEVESTNDVASELAYDGEPEGTTVTADRQTAGRGRMDRSWISPSGTNIYASVILRPAVSPWKAPQMSIVAVTALVRAVEEAAHGVHLGIKWPNDVLCSGRKLAGILCELHSDLDRVHHLVVGMGINVNMAEMGEELEGRATSLLIETGRETSRARLAGVLLNSLEETYAAWLDRGIGEFVPFWEERSVLTGCRVDIDTPSGSLCGTVRGLSPSGALELETSAGSVMEVLSGDVHISSVRERRTKVRGQ